MTAPAILVVEDNEITRKLFRIALAVEGFRVLEAPDGRTALALAAADPPDLVLQDLLLPDMNGLDLVTQLRTLPAVEAVPIVALSGFLSHLEMSRAMALGFSDFLIKPVEPSRLIHSVRACLPQRAAATEQPGQGRHVLLADDDPLQLKLARLRLEQRGFRVTAAADGATALAQARQSPPDAILSDVLMPELDGFQLCLAVRQDPSLAGVPVVLCSAHYLHESDRRLAERVGANALVGRSPDFEEAITALLKSLDQRAPAAPHDPVALLEGERLHRVAQQAERQAAASVSLVQRLTLQAAALSALAVLSSAMNRPLDVEAPPVEFLTHLLDAGGLSRGVLYLMAPDGQLRFHAQSGHPKLAAEEAERFFGHPELFRQSAEIARPITVPSPDVPARTAADLLGGLGAASAVMVPLIVREERIGMLLMAAHRRDVTHCDWLAFAQTVAGQIAQTIALSRAFSRLTASEHRYRSLFDNVPVGLYRITPQGRLLDVNQALVDMLGYPDRESLLAVDPAQLCVSPKDQASWQALAARGGILRGFEGQLRRHDGTVIWVRTNVRAHPDSDGNPAYEGSLEDVTEQKEAEAARSASEARYRGLVDGSIQGICVHTDFVLQFANPATAHIFGYGSPGELIGLDFGQLVGPHDGPCVNEGDPVPLAAELRGVRRDGTLVWLDCLATSAPWWGPGAVLVTFVDITERKRLAEQFLQAQKMEAVGRLAGGVAHDFNNALTVILGRSEMLRMMVPDSRVERQAALIEETAQRAARLTQQLLAFSRRQVLQSRVLDLNAVVTGIKPMLRHLIGEDLELVTRLAPDLARVKADPGQIDQVIVNLAVNARDAMPEGGRLILETANAELDCVGNPPAVRPGRYAMLAVTDTGTGMDRETQARIFEPFFTTKEPDRGTGLGLSTVFGIIKQSEGNIWVYSEPGVGTTFKIYLPSIDDPVDTMGPPPVAAPPRGWETILLVEDEEAVRELATETLQELGYTVRAASNGAEALGLADRHQGPLHLLMTDVIMPQMSGRQLARRLADTRPGLRVLYISGYTGTVIGSQDFLEPGMAFLQKPFTTYALARTVREVLDVHS